MSEPKSCPFCGNEFTYRQEPNCVTAHCFECRYVVLSTTADRRTPGPATKAFFDNLRKIRRTYILAGMPDEIIRCDPSSVDEVLAEWEDANG